MLETHLGVSVGSITNFTRRFLTAAIDIDGHRLAWPDEDERLAISRGFFTTVKSGFERKRGYGIPGVVGVVDGVIIRMRKPINLPDDLLAEKFRHHLKGFSYNILAACDHRARFTYALLGMPGASELCSRRPHVLSRLREPHMQAA